jgi:hypothetical protein
MVGDKYGTMTRTQWQRLSSLVWRDYLRHGQDTIETGVGMTKSAAPRMVDQSVFQHWQRKVNALR